MPHASAVGRVLHLSTVLYVPPQFSTPIKTHVCNSVGRLRQVISPVNRYSRKDRTFHSSPPKCTLMTQNSSRSLWEDITEVYERARASGVAYKTDTNTQLLKDQKYDVEFVLRVATALRDKPKPSKDSANKKEWVNPFLPYEEQLWVKHLSDSHTLLLNKFNVVAHHLICVTRTFQPQTDPLNAADLGATWEAMQAFPHGALAYFNCGPESGASQPHKHTQIVPLPLAEGAGPELPFQGIIEDAKLKERTTKHVIPLHSLPFQSYACLLPDRPTSKELEQTFKELKAAFSPTTVPDDAPVESYNMVLTSSFMMLVPRSREIYGPVAVNSMGFAGSMLVRSKEELDFLRAESPMQVLAAVGVPWSEKH
ncbi:g2462 [Coccomyxa elongata]